MNMRENPEHIGNHMEGFKEGLKKAFDAADEAHEAQETAKQEPTKEADQKPRVAETMEMDSLLPSYTDVLNSYETRHRVHKRRKSHEIGSL